MIARHFQAASQSIVSVHRTEARKNDPARTSMWNFFSLLAILFILIVLLLAPAMTSAQSSVDNIERLEVRLWPDFDRPSVLTTLVGSFPTGMPDQNMIIVPVPEGASVHVVAPLRDDGTPGAEMDFDDSTPGQLTFTTNEIGFWIEYYAPYEADGNSRNISYQWQSAIDVDQMDAVVQQPLRASVLTTEPAEESVTTGPDGLLYHSIPAREVPAGSTYLLEVDYTMVEPTLTQDALSQQSGLSEAGTPEESGLDWLLVVAIVAGVVAIGAVAWIVITSRSTKKRVAKPRPVRRVGARPRSMTTSPPPAQEVQANRYCHACGNPVGPDDRFCRSCGTAVKGRG